MDQSAMGICTFCYIENFFSVVVLHRSIVDRRRGGSVCHGYMCILLYMKLNWCSGFPEIYTQLEEGVGSVCYGYKYILLHIKLLQFIGLNRTYVD